MPILILLGLGSGDLGFIEFLGGGGVVKKGDFLQILHLQRLASLELSRPIVNGFKLLH